MLLLKRFFVAILAALISAIASAEEPDGAEVFRRDVQPILTAHCVECHGPTKQENGLRLDFGAAILRGGDNGRGWPFGGTIFYSRVYQRVFGVAGVASITRLTIVLDEEEQIVCTDVKIAPHGLLYSTEHTISVGQDAGAEDA